MVSLYLLSLFFSGERMKQGGRKIKKVHLVGNSRVVEHFFPSLIEAISEKNEYMARICAVSSVQSLNSERSINPIPIPPP